MSTIQLERPAENTIVTPDTIEPGNVEAPTPEDIEPSQLPIGVLALHDLNIEDILPPQPDVATEENHHKEKKPKKDGISERTLADLHTILSNDVHDPKLLGAARQRLEKGTLTEKALAFSLDVLHGDRYDDPTYENLSTPDTKDMTGIRSRQLAVTDPNSSFLSAMAKDSYREQRGLSDGVYSALHRLAWTSDYVKEEAEKRKIAEDGTLLRRYSGHSEQLARDAASFILEIAEHLDANTVYKLIAHVPNLSWCMSEQHRQNLEKLLGKGGEPSAGDAFVCQQIWYAHGDVKRRIVSMKEAVQLNPSSISQETLKQYEQEQRRLQDVLAGANKTRRYTANELQSLKPGLSDEDFNALHVLREHLRWSTSHEDITIYNKYIVSNPKALEIVQKSAGESVLNGLNEIIGYELGLNNLSSDRDPESVQAAEWAVEKLIDFVSSLEGPEQQEAIIGLHRMKGFLCFRSPEADGPGESVYKPERLEWLLDNVPELMKTTDIGRMVNVIEEGIKYLEEDKKKFEFGENTEEGRWLYIQQVLTSLEGLPKDGRVYTFLSQSILGDNQNFFRSPEYIEKVMRGGSEEVLNTLSQLDKVFPDWVSTEGNDLFEIYGREAVHSGNEEQFKPLYDFLAELKSYNLDTDLQSTAMNLLKGTKLIDGFEPLKTLFKPENHQILHLMNRLNVPSSAIRGFGVVTERLDSLRPIAEQLANHPIMTTLNSEEMRGQGAFVQNLLTAEDPMRYADALYQGVKIFGDFNSEDLTDMLYAVYKGGKALDLQDEFLRKIVGEGGQPGIDKLNATLSKLRDQILQGNIDTELMEHSHLHRTYLKALTRYESSQWGSHYDNNLLLLLKREQGLDSSDPHRLIDSEAYASSEILHIAEVDQDKAESFEITKDGLSQWDDILADVKVGIDITGERPGELGEVVKEVTRKVALHIERLEKGRTNLAQKLTDLPPEKQGKLQQKLTELEAEITELKEMDEATVTNPTLFLQNVSALARYKDMHREIRQVLFAAALTKFPDERERIGRLPEKPNLAELQRLADFVQHVANRETWGEVFTNFGLYKSLDQILNVNSINENIQRGLNVETAGTRDMQLVSTRGLLMELSGHIGDACWASRYESIEESFPNFTSVIMVQKPGTKDARFVGSAMLVEAKDSSGEPVLVIRGLNPIQNTIEQLDSRDFFKQFSNYVREIAQKRGMKLGVVIDDHCGGSATNRPSLYQHLSQRLKPELQPVQLADDPPTTFNGYDIRTNTFLI